MIAIRKWRLLGIFGLALWSAPVFAQGCAMCLASAMSQGHKAMQAMNLGILVLLIPPFLIIGGILTFTFLRRP